MGWEIDTNNFFEKATFKNALQKPMNRNCVLNYVVKKNFNSEKHFFNEIFSKKYLNI